MLIQFEGRARISKLHYRVLTMIPATSGAITECVTVGITECVTVKLTPSQVHNQQILRKQGSRFQYFLLETKKMATSTAFPRFWATRISDSPETTTNLNSGQQRKLMVADCPAKPFQEKSHVQVHFNPT